MINQIMKKERKATIMNDLQVVVTQELGVIDFNFEESKKFLTEKINEYKGIIITEDTIDSGKKDLAKLRNDRKAFDARRIEVKKAFMKPCDEFEAKAKQLIALFDAPIKEIADQLDLYEEKRKAAKKEDITAIYNELVGEMSEYLPLSKIYDSRWENATATPKSIRSEIETAVSSTALAVSTIKGMNSDGVEKALAGYKIDLSLPNAIAYINKYEAQKAEILAREEAKRKAEEERKQREEKEKLLQQEIVEKSASAIHIQPVSYSAWSMPIEEEPFVVGEKPFTVTKRNYHIEINEDQSEALELLLDSLGATYRRI